MARQKTDKRRKRTKNPPLHTAGGYGYTVSLMRRPGRSGLWLRWYDHGREGVVWRSLGHEDTERGERECKEMAALRMVNAGTKAQAATAGVLTVAGLFALYAAAKHLPRTMPDGTSVPPEKSARQIQDDTRRMDYWQEFLTSTRDVLTIDHDTARDYSAWRRAHGIADTTIGHEVTFLKGVFRWATQKVREDGSRLMTLNPIADVARLRSSSPNAPLTGLDRFARIYRQTDRADPRGLLRPLAMLAHEHGWRLSAWLNLWASDIESAPVVVEGVTWPYGRIRKRQANDKKRRPDKWVPMTRRSRRAALRLLRKSGATGDNYTFTGPVRKGAWSQQYALDLLHRAELLVGHGERLEFIREAAVSAGDTVRFKIGRGEYTALEYVGRFLPKIATEPEHAARIVARLNEALGTEWRASLEPENGHGFHGLRRKWGTDRKDAPLVDVAAAGDWHPATLLNHYQKADAATTLSVVDRRASRTS